MIEAGQAAERAGQRAEARAHFEAALYRLRGSDASMQAAAVLRWIARTYMLDADADAAMECADAALAVAQACSDRAGEGHAINLRAAIHWALGELDTAESLYLVARTCALEVGERALVGMTSANLGIIAAIRGDLPEALHRYSVGLESYRALDRPRDVCVALNNIGRLHTDLRRWAEAERAYAEAIEVADRIGDRSARIGLEVNVAEMWLVRGNPLRATEALGKATKLATETGDDAWKAHVAKLRGMLERDAGAPIEAEQHFAEAVERAEARQDLVLLAEALRERAGLYRGAGRNRDALQSLNRAHRLFTQLRAKRELANVDRSISRLEDDFINVVRQWGESIEAKDRYTQGHCMRVADLACAIAFACGIDGQSLFWFRIGALLHDVGKLIVPSDVLNKPGKLTDDEWALLKRHPTAGVDMLAGIDFPWDVRPIIESHHERWDGTGYPHGLSGETIPLAARILAVADVYDALTSIRSYKRAVGHNAALEIMRRDVGTAFDPAVFAKFEDVMRSGSGPTAAADLAGLASRGVDAALASIEPSSDDPETGLPLRCSMERIVAQALADRNTTKGSVSLLVIELDGDSEVSGESSGSHQRRALRRTARKLRGLTRTSDFVARTGKAQLMILLPETSEHQARTIMRRIETALSARVLRRGDGVSALGGIRTAIATAPQHGETAAELFDSAQEAVARALTVLRATRAG